MVVCLETNTEGGWTQLRSRTIVNGGVSKRPQYVTVRMANSAEELLSLLKGAQVLGVEDIESVSEYVDQMRVPRGSCFGHQAS